MGVPVALGAHGVGRGSFGQNDLHAEHGTLGEGRGAIQGNSLAGDIGVLNTPMPPEGAVPLLTPASPLLQPKELRLYRDLQVRFLCILV